MSLKKEEYYQPEELLIGQRINVFGRDCFIYDCDAATRDWYKQCYDYEMVAIPLKKQKANVAYNPVPPYNGYGTPEDSLGSVYSL